MFVYRSPIGLMVIKNAPSSSKFMLIINNVCYGYYPSAVAAADDVYCHATGCFEWDKLDGQLLNVPTDIYEWEVMSD